MHAAGSVKRIVKPHALADALPVDEYRDMGPKMTLFIQYVSAQPRILHEGDFQRFTQDCRGSLDLGDFRKASQLLREDQPGHGVPEWMRWGGCPDGIILIGCRARIQSVGHYHDRN